MSKKDWRFDPNEDYRDYDENSYNRGDRNGFRPMRKGKKFKKDKFDGKRRSHEEERW